MSDKIELGMHVRELFSGFEGAVTGIAEYLTGCCQVLVQPLGLDREGAMRKSEWIDEGRLTVDHGKMQYGILSRSTTESSSPGGPQANPAPKM